MERYNASSIAKPRSLQFFNFVPEAYRRGLVRTLFCGQMIYTHGQVQKEEITKQTSLANGFSKNSIKQHRRQEVLRKTDKCRR